MGLNSAHEGYEYQDLLSAYYILKEVINGSECNFNIDKKDSKDDKFDDLSIIYKNKVIKKQIKYSNENTDYTLKKEDFSTKDQHDLALDILFHSWSNYSSKENIELFLELSWNEPEEDLLPFLKIFNEDNKKTFINTTLYKINVDALWPEGSEPHNSWRRFRNESKNIDRTQFEEFCDKLIIEVRLPKASLNIYEPGILENFIIELVKKLGVGIYPNNHITIEEATLNLLHRIKNARAQAKSFSSSDVFTMLNLKVGHGSIHQEFLIDEKSNIIQENLFSLFLKKVEMNNKIVIFGEPGAGKSWFIQNLITVLYEKKINVMRHYCYVGMEDEYSVDRIKTDVFYGNLINDLLNYDEKLKSYKTTVLGSNFEELQLLLNNIKDETVLIIDGLDHIERIFKIKGHGVSESEIQIVKEILRLNIPSNIKLIIATQPLERDNFIDNGFQIETLPPCNLEFVCSLLENQDIKDIEFESKGTLSQKLLEKSNGNALYLSYLIKEIKKLEILTENRFDILPPYSFNLESYYGYLMTKLNYRESIVYTLCGVSFPLLREEIQEICQCGDFLQEILKVLEPVLNENTSTGGLVLYHESFRRYIIDYLKNRKLDIRRHVFRDLIEWFDNKDFYKNIKKYKFYLSVLFDAEEYLKILSHLNENFIVDSLFFAYSRRLIIKNYKFFLKAACEEKNYEALIILSELGRVLDGTKEQFYDMEELYFRVVGELNGYNYLSQRLSYENVPSFNFIEGLRLCYLCSKNGIIPNWNLYLEFENAKEIELENYKYYIRAYLDLNSIEAIKIEIEKTTNLEYLEFSKIIKFEYSEYFGNDACKEIFIEINSEFWQNHLDTSSKKDKLSFKDISRDILYLDKFHSKELYLVTDLFQQIDYFLDTDKSKISLFINEINQNNWFYNWIIFVINTKEILYNIHNTSEELEQKLIETYTLLINSLDPFLGIPRLCDLYFLRPLIYKTIKEPLKYIQSVEGWNSILTMLDKISSDTTTYLQNYPSGVLDMENFSILMEEIANENNIDIIIGLFDKRLEQEKEDSFYSSLANYKMRLALIYSRAKALDKAKILFKDALVFHTAYTERKDRTLSELLDSILSINTLDSEVGLKYIKKTKTLVDTVVDHTDGKGTSHYPIEWFEKFMKVDKRESLLYLRMELLNNDIYWILEDSLFSFISDGEYNPVVMSYLLKMYPNKKDNKDFLNLYIKNVKHLILHNKLNLAKISLYDFYNRLTFVKNLDFDKDIQDSINEISKDLNVELPELNYKEAPIKLYNELDDVKENNNKFSLTDLSILEIIHHFMLSPLQEQNIFELTCYFEKLPALNDEVKFLIDILTNPSGFSLDKFKHLDNLKLVFENMKGNTEIYAYANTSLYCFKEDGWYRKFVDIDLYEKGYTTNTDIAETVFFRNAYEILKEPYYRTGVSSNILNSMVRVRYSKETTTKAWETLYRLIDNRLPEKNEYCNWDEALTDDYNMNIDELLVCVLLTKLKLGEVERQKWVLSGLNFLLYNTKELTIKPLKWFFNNRNEFLEVSFLLILQLLFEFCQDDDSDFKNNFIEDLKKIYPTENFMINFMLQDFLDIFEEEKVPLNIVTANRIIGTTELKSFIDIFPMNRLLNYFKFNLKASASNFYEETHNLEFRKKIHSIFGNERHQVFVRNIYLSNIYQKYINLYLQDYFNNKSFLGNLSNDTLFYNIKYDTNTLVAQQNSIIIRPKDINLPSSFGKENEIVSKIDLKSDWIRIAYFEEEERFISYNSKEPIRNLVYQAAIFPEASVKFPYINEPLNSYLLWEKFFHYSKCLEVKNTFVVSNISFSPDVLWDIRILLLHPNLMAKLELELRDPVYGIVGYSKNNEDILKYERWDTDYIGYDDLHYEIPQLRGAQLLIRKDYFEKICDLSKFQPKLLTIKW